MWYWDKYLESNDLTSRLVHSTSGTILTGFVDKLPEISARHSWKEAGGGMAGAVKKFVTVAGNSVRALANEGENLGNSVVNAVAEGTGQSDLVQATSVDYNKRVTNNQSMLKEFDSTEIDIPVPNFTVIFINDQLGKSARGELMAALAATELLGKSEVGLNDITTYAPCQFRYAAAYKPNIPVVGSFSIVNSKMTLRNLLPESVSIELSDTAIADINEPLYYKLNISFTYGKKPTQLSAYDYIQHNAAPSVSYEDISPMFKEKSLLDSVGDRFGSSVNSLTK